MKKFILLLLLSLSLFSCASFETARLNANKAVSLSNMRQVIIAAYTYHNQHGQMPDTLEQISPELFPVELLPCPITQKRYQYFGKGINVYELKNPYEKIILQSAPLKDNSLLCVFADGHAGPISVEELLAKKNAEIKQLKNERDQAAFVFENWSPQIEKSARSKGPVLLFSTARWCATCQENYRFAIVPNEALLKTKGFKILIADNTKKNPLIKKLLKEHESPGVPLTVIFMPGKKPQKLPETFTAEEFAAYLKKQ